jgi:hypothetical protein
MSPAAPRAIELTSPFGWSASVDVAGVVTLRDPAGQPRAIYQGTASSSPAAALPRGGTHTVRLPDGDVALHNGATRAARRRDHDGHLDLHGRRYVFHHTWGWNTEVSCDGVRVARLHRRTSRKFTVRTDASRDETDRLAVALCWFAVQPGREGAIAAAFHGL